jgi:hypothetical protein
MRPFKNHWSTHVERNYKGTSESSDALPALRRGVPIGLFLSFIFGLISVIFWLDQLKFFSLKRRSFVSSSAQCSQDTDATGALLSVLSL